MDVLLPAWESFCQNGGPTLASLERQDGGSEMLDDTKAFRERLIAFIKVMQEVLQKLNEVCRAAAEDSGSDTKGMSESTDTTQASTSGMEMSRPNSTEMTLSEDQLDMKGSGETETAVMDLESTKIPEVDDKLVQIKASKSEIERRINAFIERKQQEVDEMNRREFCSVFSLTSGGQSEETCARTDAVFIPRAGSSSHVKVSRVVNTQGPQTVPGYPGNSPGRAKAVQVKPEPEDGTAAVEERVQNIEQHLHVQQDPKSSKDMFSRLKCLENRILYLESLSPEYFNNGPPLPKLKRRHQDRQVYAALNSGELTPHYKDLSVEEIDVKMKELKEKLLSGNVR